LNNAATLLVFGGARDPEDLSAYSTLTGEREEKVHTLDPDGDRASTTTRRVPVLSAGQIAQLPFRRVVIIRRGMAPAVGKVALAWKRRDVRTAQRRVRLVERAGRWAARRGRWAAVWQHATTAVVIRFDDATTRARSLATRLTGGSAERAATRETVELVETSHHEGGDR
jgi:hypothetical protein